MKHIPEDLRLLHTYAKDDSIRELVERVGNAEHLNRELLEALKVAEKLLRLVTIRDVIEAGDDAIRAVGLNPWCMNEGRASGDETIPLDFIHRAIAKATAPSVETEDEE